MKVTVGLSALALGLAGLPGDAGADPGEGVAGIAQASGLMHAAPVRRFAAGAAPTTFTGTIKLTLTVDIVTGGARISRDAPVKCSLNANVHNADFTDSVADVSQQTVAITGSQVTCSLLIPYAWPLYDAANDLLYLGYNISFFDDAGNGRNTYVQMPTQGVPANGTTLTFSRSARL